MELSPNRPTMDEVRASSSLVEMDTRPVAFHARAEPSVGPYMRMDVF